MGTQRSPGTWGGRPGDSLPHHNNPDLPPKIHSLSTESSQNLIHGRPVVDPRRNQNNPDPFHRELKALRGQQQSSGETAALRREALQERYSPDRRSFKATSEVPLRLSGGGISDGADQGEWPASNFGSFLIPGISFAEAVRSGGPGPLPDSGAPKSLRAVGAPAAGQRRVCFNGHFELSVFSPADAPCLVQRLDRAKTLGRPGYSL